VAPAFEAIAQSKLGFNNGYPAADGVIRRYRYVEPLSDASQIQSLALAAARHVQGKENATINAAMKSINTLGSRPFFFENTTESLITWKANPGAYPKVSFADVFAQADGQKSDPVAKLPSFAGKVILIGSTAASLHDIHPTPLSPTMPGVETMATAIDNALNDRFVAELSRWLQAAVALGAVLGIALWAQFKSISSLDQAVIALPASLMALSFWSLHGWPVFLDLQLAAGLALIYLALLRWWTDMRRDHWCSMPPRSEDLAIWPLLRDKPWVSATLDRLIAAVEKHAPGCRILVMHTADTGTAQVRWPDLARYGAIIGPSEELTKAKAQLEKNVKKLGCTWQDMALWQRRNKSEDQLAATAFGVWAKLEARDTKEHS
jgi:hypothetical protein